MRTRKELNRVIDRPAEYQIRKGSRIWVVSIKQQRKNHWAVIENCLKSWGVTGKVEITETGVI